MATKEERSDTVSTCEMMSNCSDFNINIHDSLTSQEKRGYIAEHQSDLVIYLSSTKKTTIADITNSHSFQLYQQQQQQQNKRSSIISNKEKVS